jgi:hypothetical protein
VNRGPFLAEMKDFERYYHPEPRFITLICAVLDVFGLYAASTPYLKQAKPSLK